MDNANPYSAPRAVVHDVGHERGGRPGWVWAITLLLAFGVVTGGFGSVDAMRGHPFGGQAAAEALKHLVPADHVIALVNLALSGWAGVELFRLKRRAFPLFVAAFALGVLVFCLNMLLRPAYGLVFEGGGFWSLGMGWAINLIIIAYVWRLRTAGILTR